jgi:MFS transporter, DHA1 family, multidrug resistance protein
MTHITKLHPVTVFFLVASMPMVASSLDMFLPALPAMVKEFGTDETTIQISLTLNIVASALLGFFSGIISDQIGRRPMFVSGLFVFAVATLLCSFASNVMFFSIARTLQGAASGIIFVMVTAILSDVYSGVKKAQVLGIATFLFPVALGFAPFLGEKVFRYFGWPATFISLSGLIFLGFFILFFLLPETKLKETTPPSVKRIYNDCKHILLTPAFLVNAATPSVFMGAFMAFVAYSPFIYMNYFALSSKTYVFYFIMPLVAQFFSGVFYQVIVKVLGINRTLMCGVLLALFALLGVAGMALEVLPVQPLALMLSMLFYNSAIPFVLPTVMAKAFEAFPSSKGGTVSSMASIVRNFTMVLFLFVSGCVFNDTPFPILWLLICGVSLFMVLSIISIQMSGKNTTEAA